MKIEQDKFGGKVYEYTAEIVSSLNGWGDRRYVDLEFAKKEIKKIKKIIIKLEEHISEIEKVVE